MEVCHLFVDEDGSYPFANGLNRLAHQWGWNKNIGNLAKNAKN
jgi:hypothetical protein